MNIQNINDQTLWPDKALRNSVLLFIMGMSLCTSSFANEKEELLKLKNTTINLIDLLVEQGVLDKQKAKSIIQAAEQKAEAEAKQQVAEESNALDNAGQTKGSENGKNAKTVRVTYVPDFVKEEIRDQVRAELKNDVIKDVKADAQKEAWGIPAALPEWIRNTKISGDARLRAQNDSFGSGNAQVLDYAAINQAGGLDKAAREGKGYLNTNQDRFRFRERFRLAIDSKITEQLRAGLRVATTNDFSPVSNNQTLGNTGKTYEVALDRAFLEYDFVNSHGQNYLTLSGGRIPNPWLSTDMMFSPELSFEGFAGTFRLPIGSNSQNLDRTAYKLEPSARFGLQGGRQNPNSMFMTLGVFPLQEVDLSTKDKWLFGGQLGGDWMLRGNSRVMVAAAYYDYHNVRARPNGINSFKYDWTSPQFMQKGNSMAPIVTAQNVDADARCYAQSTGCLWGLASDFKIFNATAMYDFAGFGENHVFLSADYAKNMGFNGAKIASDFPGYWQGLSSGNRSDKTNAFQVRADIGKAEIRQFKDWSILAAYRYLERDAILDAFTDTIFHQGGTDAKGYVLGFSYGLMKNTWVNMRWFSTDIINGPPLSIDTATLDLNVRL